VAWPQHDAFSDGSQQLACLTGEQQLAGWAGLGSPLLVGDDDAVAGPDTEFFMEILLLVAFPVSRVSH
jgi:hypothetical protein